MPSNSSAAVRNGNGNGHSAQPLDLRRPVGIDLFAGAGGLSLGFEQAGFDIAASAEYDPVHAATHEFNFPLTKVLCADVAELNGARLRAEAEEGVIRHGRSAGDAGEIDVIFGGPPCQGFSSIGKRLVDDKRNRLVFHFFRLVEELQPRYFVMENVPGMKRGGHASILEKLIREFEEARYQVIQPPQVLNAAEFGVPQDRRRLFLIGARSDQPLPNYPAATTTPVPKRPAQGDEVPPDADGPTVWDAIGDLPDLDRFDRLRDSDEVTLHPRTLAAMERAASPYARRLRDADPDPANLGHRREWDRAVLTSSQRTDHIDRSIKRFRATRHGDTEPVSRFLKLDPDGLCNTLRAGTGSERGAFTSPRPIHPKWPRVISVREAARLHSFPDWFRFHETKWHGFRQIGNAVAPLVGRAVAAEIAAVLAVSPPVPTGAMPLGDRRLLTMNMSEAADHFGADRSAIPPRRVRTQRAGGRVAA